MVSDFKPGDIVEFKKKEINKIYNWFRNRDEIKYFHKINNKRMILTEDLAGYWIARISGTNNVYIIPTWTFEKEGFQSFFNKLEKIKEEER